MSIRRVFASSAIVSALCAAGAAACGQAPEPTGEETSQGLTASNTAATSPLGAQPVRGGKGPSPDLTPTPLPTTTITENGGPVMTGATKVYYIWYGNWANDTATTILPDLANHIGGSPYWAINTQYPDTSGRRPFNAVTYAGSTVDAYSKGSSLSKADVTAIALDAIKSKRLPADNDAVYFVLTSSDVTMPGFCSDWCGYHYAILGSGIDYKIAFAGDPDPTTCGGCYGNNQQASPNGNPGADAMASVIAHELEEAVTDPHGDAWHAAGDEGENADLCVYTYGDTYPANGGVANMHLGDRDYLIQQSLIPQGTPSCALELRYTHPSGSTGASVRGDFDGDHIADILWRDVISGTISTWLMSSNGTPRTEAVTYNAIPANWQIDGAADFDGDGKTDILWRDNQTGEVSTWTMNGTTPTSFNVVYSSVPLAWQIAGTGDFNADGMADILWRNASTGEISVWQMSGSTPTAYLSIASASLDWQIVGTGDFDGDGDADILWRNATSGEISTWLMNHYAPTYLVTFDSLDAGIDIAGIGDVSGDGRSDVILRDLTSGDVSAWLMNGGTIASSSVLYRGAPREWRIYGAADMSGDRTADLLWRDARTGDVSVWMIENAAPARFVLTASAVPLEQQIMAD